MRDPLISPAAASVGREALVAAADRGGVRGGEGGGGGKGLAAAATQSLLGGAVAGFTELTAGEVAALN